MGKSHRDERRSGKYIQNCFPELLAMAKFLISYARRFAHAMLHDPGSQAPRDQIRQGKSEVCRCADRQSQDNIRKNQSTAQLIILFAIRTEPLHPPCVGLLLRT
jgi:hypothetical protein